MDIKKFRVILEDPSKAKGDLLLMRENAMKRRALAYVQIAEEVLDARFSGWRTPRGGGGKSTDIVFRGQSKQFFSEKEAYFWLMERFIQYAPKAFEGLDWSSYFRATGARTLYFARSLGELFQSAPSHANDPNKFYLLKNGWYAKALLTEKQKLELLLKFAAVASLPIREQWDWNGYAERFPGMAEADILRTLASSA